MELGPISLTKNTLMQATGNDLHIGRSYKAEELIPWVSTKVKLTTRRFPAVLTVTEFQTPS